MVRPPVADNICIRCKGARLLCGKKQCPILMKHSVLKSNIPDSYKSVKKGKEVFGASPPAVFVGHQGYPKVNIGPMLPLGHYSELKNTKFLDTPENWFGKPIEEIVGYRSGMIRSNFRVGVKYQENVEETMERVSRPARKLLESTQELTMASNSVDTEAKFKRVWFKMQYDNHSQPQGPSGQAKEIKVIDNVKVERVVDKVVYDTDLKASEAVFGYLYDSNDISLSSMQRLFSSGLLGEKKNRKLVPTRWTITAVDDIIGKGIREQIMHYPEIDKYFTYYGEYLDNKFLILLMPGRWSFEMNECWNAQSIWNRAIPGVNQQREVKPVIMTDWEPEGGMKGYADNVTGAYYAARKEVEEFLFHRRRQARAIVFREVAGGYVVPLGVWVIRETVKNTLSQGLKGENVQIHQTLPSALNSLNKVFQIPKKYWTKSSKLLKYIRRQSRLDKWL